MISGTPSRSLDEIEEIEEEDEDMLDAKDDVDAGRP